MPVDRSLLTGSTTMLVLKLLENKDMYGYEMIEQLGKRSQNIFSLKAGTLYPLPVSYTHLDVYKRQRSIPALNLSRDCAPFGTTKYSARATTTRNISQKKATGSRRSFTVKLLIRRKRSPGSTHGAIIRIFISAKTAACILSSATAPLRSRRGGTSGGTTPFAPSFPRRSPGGTAFPLGTPLPSSSGKIPLF